MSTTIRYRDGSFTSRGGWVGFPCLAVVNRKTVLIGDWNGRICIFDLDSFSVAGEVLVHDKIISNVNPRIIAKIAVEPVHGRICAAATRMPSSVIWNIGESDYSLCESSKVVNDVTYSPDGRWLAMGLGFYSLHGMQRLAGLELWGVDNGVPSYKAGSVALPGCCVDRIAWAADSEELACITGALSQRAGFIVRIDRESLSLLSFDELPRAMARQATYDGINLSACILVLDHEQLGMYTSEGRQRWVVDAPENLDIALDLERRELVLTDGTIRDVDDGSVRREIAPLDGCSALAIRPGGGYIGVSKSGVIRVWEEIG